MCFECGWNVWSFCEEKKDNNKQRREDKLDEVRERGADKKEVKDWRNEETEEERKRREEKGDRQRGRGQEQTVIILEAAPACQRLHRRSCRFPTF